MARVFCILLLLGAIGCFVVSTKDTIWVQTGSISDAGHLKNDPPRTYRLTDTDRIGYGVVGVLCLGGSIYSFTISFKHKGNENKSA